VTGNRQSDHRLFRGSLRRVSVRFMRVKIEEAEVKLVPLLPNGETDFQEGFGRMFGYRGQILVILLICLFAIPAVIQFPSSLTIGTNEEVKSQIPSEFSWQTYKPAYQLSELNPLVTDANPQPS
jgi:hypothetical protein